MKRLHSSLRSCTSDLNPPRIIMERMLLMPVQRFDVIYIDFKFNSVPSVGSSDFALNRQRVEALGTRLTASAGAPS
jgi:hypothetical protein